MKTNTIWSFLCLSLLITVFFSIGFYAFDNKVDWEKFYGGEEAEEFNAMTATSDGGFANIGYTRSKGLAKENIWIVRTDAQGNTLWDKIFGGNSWNKGNAIIEAKNGDLIAAGAKGHHDKTYTFDSWVVRLDPQGKVIWEKSYPLGEGEVLHIHETTDGGFILAGYVFFDKHYSIRIIKINAKGELIWEIVNGDKNINYRPEFTYTNDKGVFITGYKETVTRTSGKVSLDREIFLTHLNDNGKLIWEKTYGFGKYLSSNTILPLSDDKILMIGSTMAKGAGSFDALLFCVDQNGKLLWEKTIGDRYSNVATTACLNHRGNILIGGRYSYGGIDSKAWLVEVDQSGTSLREKIFGSGAFCSIDALSVHDKEINFAGCYQKVSRGDFDGWMGAITLSD